jgi:FtsP/CotA-like multicopper oxidase with cupredoxin domain
MANNISRLQRVVIFSPLRCHKQYFGRTDTKNHLGRVSSMNRRKFLALSSAAAASRIFAQSPLTHAAPPSALEKPDAVLRIQPVTVELAPGVLIRTTGYNGHAPGPILRFKEGSPVNIEVHNETSADELVHWHGMAIDSLNDGAMEEGSPMIPAGGHLRYSFRPKPSGTRWYHTHTTANADLMRATYTGQYGFFHIEPRFEPGAYDQEIFLAIHHWQPHLMRMGAPMNANDVAYKYASFNDRLFSAAEPIRVRQGQRILFRFLNASATENVTLALPGHLFTVIAMDGNPVPQPRSVETITLGVAERIDAIIEMTSPGVWLLGSTDDAERASGLGRTIEYAGRTGKPIWATPGSTAWDYLYFANEAKAPTADVRIPLVIAPLPAGPDGMQRWTINGKGFPDNGPILIERGKRHRLVFVNSSAEKHPLHLHRHSFELVSLGTGTGSGLIKDTINVPPHSTTEVDFLADNPGDTLFHCHQQLHMDYGFMQLFKYT